MYPYLPIIFDVICILFILFFLIRGVKRGFILTLFSLVSVLLALVTAGFVSDKLTPNIVSHWEPILSEYLNNTVQEELTKPENDSEESNGGQTDNRIGRSESGNSHLPSITDALRKNLGNYIQKIAHDATENVLSVFLSRIVRVVLFLLVFLLSLLLLFLLSRALNIVASLPVLRGGNAFFGGLIGLIKGLVLLYILVRVLYIFTDFPPGDIIEKTYFLRFFIHSGSKIFFP